MISKIIKISRLIPIFNCIFLYQKNNRGSPHITHHINYLYFKAEMLTSEKNVGPYQKKILRIQPVLLNIFTRCIVLHNNTILFTSLV